MDFYEGHGIELGPKGYARFERQRRGHGRRAFQERIEQLKQKCGGQSTPVGLDRGILQEGVGGRWWR